MKRAKRLLAISDSHCGHVVGLTHPDFDAKPAYPRPTNSKAENEKAVIEHEKKIKLYRIRRILWDYFEDSVKALAPIDAVIFCGDAIEGKAPKSGATELITADRVFQSDMAVSMLNSIDAPKKAMVYGTGYHTGNDEDWEDLVARQARNIVKIGGHDTNSVNGVLFDYKHFIGGSQIPQGRHTAVAKENVWNLFWSEFGEDARADVFLRGHVHSYNFCGGYNWLGMTLPALCGKGSKHGVRKCSGTVDFGLVWFDVYGKGDYTWGTRIQKIKAGASSVLKLA